MRKRAAPYEDMVALVKAGVMGKDVAAQFGVHPTTVSRAMRVSAQPPAPPKVKTPFIRKPLPAWKLEQRREGNRLRNIEWRARRADARRGAGQEQRP